jgi:hypothetical protein
LETGEREGPLTCGEQLRKRIARRRAHLAEAYQRAAPVGLPQRARDPGDDLQVDLPREGLDVLRHLSALALEHALQKSLLNPAHYCDNVVCDDGSADRPASHTAPLLIGSAFRSERRHAGMDHTSIMTSICRCRRIYL